MSPLLASSLFGMFIGWLLLHPSRSGSKLSGALWVPAIWVWIIASKPVISWFQGRQTEIDVSSYLDGNPVDRNIFLVLMFLGIVTLARRRIDWGAIIRENRWLWIFYAYLLLSVVWSDFTAVAFRRWVKDIGNVIMVLIIATDPQPAAAVRGVFLRCAYLLVPLSVLTIKWYPDIGRYYHRWTYATCFCGITVNKNSLGLLAMMSGQFVFWQILGTWRGPGWFKAFRRVLPEVIILLMCVWILRIAESATALVCFLIGLGALVLSRMNWVKARLGLLSGLACCVALFLIAFTTMPGLRHLIAGSLGRDVTLTGRTDIWEAVLDLKTNPAVGAGFASIWLMPNAMRVAEDLKIPHAHNGYLETYLNSGLIGVALLVMVLLSAGRNLGRELRAGTAVGPLWMALFACCLIYNYTEVAYNNNNILGFSLLLMAVKLRSPAEISETPWIEDTHPEGEGELEAPCEGGLAEASR